MRRALLTVVALLATLLTAPVVSAAQSVRVATPALAGVTVLTGDRSARITVHSRSAFTLRDPSFVPEARNDLAVRAARFGGFALRSADGKRAFVGGSLPGALRTRTFIQNIKGDDGRKTQWTLPAGTYSLYLLAPSPKTTVTIAFGRLRGHTALRPKDPRELMFDVPIPALPTPAPYVRYGAGLERTITRLSLHFAYMTITQPLLTEIHHSTCFYVGRPTGPTPYEPGCPGIAAFSAPSYLLISDENTTSQTFGFFSGLPDAPPGTYGTGMAFVSASTASAVGHHQAWMGW